jgi:hypothetical protein
MRGALSILVLVWILASPVLANAPDCEALAEEAAARHGIPEGVLAAIARTESGGGLRSSAWPWTLNRAGEGMYLGTEGEALAQLGAILETGHTNVDVGCMQVNWRWHGEAFDSLEQMMDPAANTEYAARFLVDLWRREGTWDAAVQAYHSTDPERGAAYLARVERNRRAGGGALVAAAAPVVQAEAPEAMSTGDGRFAAQAPLVALAAVSTQSGPAEEEPDDPLALSGLPEGALPNLSRAPSTGPVAGDRLARIRAGFGAAIR